jgi:threonine/homoserine/homoserine lactone efflux protein
LADLILKGIVTGFVLSIMIGPVFFILLETSIKKGIRAALSFDFGVLLSDIFYIIVAYIFYSEVSSLTNGKNEGILKIVGGCVFLVYGIFNFLKKPNEHESKDAGKLVNNTYDYFMLFIKGFALNVANPLVIFYWFGVLALGAKNENPENSGYTFIYIFVILLTFFMVDVLKIIGAKRLRPYITSSVLKSLNRITGSILIIFGIVILMQGIISKM